MRTVLRRFITVGVIVALTALAGLSAGATSAGASSLQGPGGVHTNSHSGCNDDVCITVDGSGLYVNYIFTSGHNTNTYAINSTPSYSINGTRHTGLTRTINPGDTSSYTWNVQRSYTNGTVICVAWTNISGYPCATVSG